jgi:hypothetical protein
VPEFMSSSLVATLDRMVCIEKHTGTTGVLKCEETGDARSERADVHSQSQIEFQQTQHVTDWCQAKPKPVPQFSCVLLRLTKDVSGQERPLWWIAEGPADAQKILEFDLGPN